MGNSAASEGRTEDAGDLLEEAENTQTASGGEVEEQERLPGVRAEEDIRQMLPLEESLDSVDGDIDLAVREDLGNILIINILEFNCLYLTLTDLFILGIGEPVARNVNFLDGQLLWLQ